MFSKPRKKGPLFSGVALGAFLALYFLPTVQVFADDLKARAELNWRYGSKRGIAMSEFWVPINQHMHGNDVLYGDLRLMGDDDDNHEGNIGVGYRKIVVIGNVKGIAGLHGWFDRRMTDRGSKFNQVTIGGEWLGENFDVLANGYVPLSNGQKHFVPNANPSAPVLAGTGIYVSTDATILEEPQAGADLELGWKVPLPDNFVDSMRIYGGGYYFDSAHTNNIAGWRTRISADVTSNFELGARFQKDDERGSQGFLEATIRFPFGNKKSYRKEGLNARLDESPERDIDIVTGGKQTNDGNLVPVVNKSTGQAQQVLHVDNTVGGGGDGSAEHPYNTLAAAQAAASAHTIIYLHAGDGTTANQNQGIVLTKTGEQLIGSGANFYYDSGNFTTASGASPYSTLLKAATTAPVITNVNANSNGVYIGADDVTVAGITIDGATKDGLQIYNSSNVTIENVTSKNSARYGMSNYSTDSETHSFYVNGLTVQSSLNAGMYISADSGGKISTARIENTTITGSTGTGLALQAQHSSTIENIILDHITSNTNTIDGVRIVSNDSGTVGNISLSNLTTTGNSSYGTRLYAYNSGYIGSSTISNLATSGNTLDGLRLHAANAGSFIAGSTISGGTFSGNTQHGVIIYAEDSGAIGSSSISSASISGSGVYNVYIRAKTDGSLYGVKLESNTITGGSSNGVYLDDDTNGTFIADLGGGVLGSIGQNSISGNTGTELRVDVDGDMLKAENNWWGVNTGLAGGEVTLDDGSSVDSDPFLTSAP